MLAAKLARDLGADAAIVTTNGGGNAHTDTMLTVRACERAGVRAVAVVAEMSGLTDWVPEADSIVSCGNAEEQVDAWAPTASSAGRASSTAATPPAAAPSRSETTSARPARWANRVCEARAGRRAIAVAGPVSSRPSA